MATVRAVPMPTTDVETKVRLLLQEYTRAFNEGDLETLKTLYVNDCVALPPNQRPAAGITAICDLLKWLREGGEANLRIDLNRIIESSELTVGLGTYKVEYRAPDGTFALDRGKEFMVLQRQPNGDYRFLIQGWSSDLPPMLHTH